MASAREHLTLAAEMADEAYEISTSRPEESLAIATVANAHGLIARGLIELQRVAWLGTAEELLADIAVEDVRLPENDEGPAAATAGPSDA